jgi:hypothetical protein
VVYKVVVVVAGLKYRKEGVGGGSVVVVVDEEVDGACSDV